MQPVSIPRFHHLPEDRSHIRVKFHQSFRRAQADEPVRIRERAQQRRNNSRIGKIPQTDNGPKPHEPDGVSREFVEQIERQPRLRVR